MGVVEFTKFCHHLDASFESPLGRKFIYAATDAEEHILSGYPSVHFGRWFGKSKAKKDFKSERWRWVGANLGKRQFPGRPMMG